MWAYIVRRVLYNIPVYLGIILLVMLALRVNDPVYAYLGKSADEQQIQQKRENMGLNRPFPVQYFTLLTNIVTLDFSARSWEQEQPVAEIISNAVPATTMITVPALFLTASISITIGLVCAFSPAGGGWTARSCSWRCWG
jgi:peptide/nickel transport system permease protein